LVCETGTGQQVAQPLDSYVVVVMMMMIMMITMTTTTVKMFLMKEISVRFVCIDTYIVSFLDSDYEIIKLGT
jgi:hypothetical protein